jgi:hypothetical protein
MLSIDAEAAPIHSGPQSFGSHGRPPEGRRIRVHPGGSWSTARPGSPRPTDRLAAALVVAAQNHGLPPTRDTRPSSRCQEDFDIMAS